MDEVVPPPPPRLTRTVRFHRWYVANWWPWVAVPVLVEWMVRWIFPGPGGWAGLAWELGVVAAVVGATVVLYRRPSASLS
jgi:hypothetical protein